ncbi:26938_t:CDS:1, partial [Dentiscutata erythropus]
MNIIKILCLGTKNLQDGSLIFGILMISLGLSIIGGVTAQDKSCQVLMCVETGGSVAVGSSSGLSEAQTYVTRSCPGVTNFTTCYVDCSGPYTGQYWTWKSCSALGDFHSTWITCGDTSVLAACKVGGDPNYPFNTPTPTNSPNSNNPSSNSQASPKQNNNCANGSTCINYNSQTNQLD